MKFEYDQPVFDTAEVAEFAQIPHETLQQWIKRGIVRLTRPGPGRGKKRLYAVADLYLFAVLRDLNLLNQPPGVLGDEELQERITTAGWFLYQYLTGTGGRLRRAWVEQYFYLVFWYDPNAQRLAFTNSAAPYLRNPHDWPVSLSLNLFTRLFRLIEFARCRRDMSMSLRQAEEIERYNEEQRKEIRALREDYGPAVEAAQVAARLGASTQTAEEVIAQRDRWAEEMEKTIIKMGE